MISMRTTLDGKILFDEQGLEIAAESIERARIEKAIPGVDGVLSIDLGERGRKIKQKGRLRAASQAELERQILQIKGFMDEEGHTLRTSAGQEYEDLRMDSFKVTGNFVSGCLVGVDYQIEYRQLKV
jgi:hypothetical protein